MTTWFNVNRRLATDEFNEIEMDSKRLHLWGHTFYRTAFGKNCQTSFNASVGGHDFIANLRALRRKQKGPDFRWTVSGLLTARL